MPIKFAETHQSPEDSEKNLLLGKVQEDLRVILRKYLKPCYRPSDSLSEQDFDYYEFGEDPESLIMDLTEYIGELIKKDA